MTNNQLLKFFQLQRQIFGVCPYTGNIFRLSDCHIDIKNQNQIGSGKLKLHKQSLTVFLKNLMKDRKKLQSKPG